ncbi:MAG TPA: class II glutamine amidotransferase [Polyangiaceae bacterium]|nr:class II glutamine amidotransferase [Polyangiaceae bacterium]
MSRVLALVGNRPDVCGVAAKKYAHLLQVETHGKALGWGIGFYQAGEALLRRRPLDDREVIEISALNDISAGLLIAQIRTPGVGALRTENTPPFRYRDWLFAQRGTITAFEQIRDPLLERVPEFLRCNLRGETDGEAMFYSFLSCLDEAVGLDRDRISAAQIREALRAAMTRLERLLGNYSASGASSGAAIDWFVSDGEHLVTLHRTGTLMYRRFEAPEELEALLPEGPPGASLHPFRCSVIASGLDAPPEHWLRVESARLVTLNRTDPPVIEAL